MNSAPVFLSSQQLSVQRAARESLDQGHTMQGRAGRALGGGKLFENINLHLPHRAGSLGQDRKALWQGPLDRSREMRGI